MPYSIPKSYYFFGQKDAVHNENHILSVAIRCRVGFSPCYSVRMQKGEKKVTKRENFNCIGTKFGSYSPTPTQ